MNIMAALAATAPSERDHHRGTMHEDEQDAQRDSWHVWDRHLQQGMQDHLRSPHFSPPESPTASASASWLWFASRPAHLSIGQPPASYFAEPFPSASAMHASPQRRVPPQADFPPQHELPLSVRRTASGRENSVATPGLPFATPIPEDTSSSDSSSMHTPHAPAPHAATTSSSSSHLHRDAVHGDEVLMHALMRESDARSRPGRSCTGTTQRPSTPPAAIQNFPLLPSQRAGIYSGPSRSHSDDAPVDTGAPSTESVVATGASSSSPPTTSQPQPPGPEGSSQFGRAARSWRGLESVHHIPDEGTVNAPSAAYNDEEYNAYTAAPEGFYSDSQRFIRRRFSAAACTGPSARSCYPVTPSIRPSSALHVSPPAANPPRMTPTDVTPPEVPEPRNDSFSQFICQRRRIPSAAMSLRPHGLATGPQNFPLCTATESSLRGVSESDMHAHSHAYAPPTPLHGATSFEGESSTTSGSSCSSQEVSAPVDTARTLQSDALRPRAGSPRRVGCSSWVGRPASFTDDSPDSFTSAREALIPDEPGLPLLNASSHIAGAPVATPQQVAPSELHAYGVSGSAMNASVGGLFGSIVPSSAQEEELMLEAALALSAASEQFQAAPSVPRTPPLPVDLAMHGMHAGDYTQGSSQGSPGAAAAAAIARMNAAHDMHDMRVRSVPRPQNEPASGSDPRQNFAAVSFYSPGCSTYNSFYRAAAELQRGGRVEGVDASEADMHAPRPNLNTVRTQLNDSRCIDIVRIADGEQVQETQHTQHAQHACDEEVDRAAHAALHQRRNEVASRRRALRNPTRHTSRGHRSVATRSPSRRQGQVCMTSTPARQAMAIAVAMERRPRTRTRLRGQGNTERGHRYERHETAARRAGIGQQIRDARRKAAERALDARRNVGTRTWVAEQQRAAVVAAAAAADNGSRSSCGRGSGPSRCGASAASAAAAPRCSGSSRNLCRAASSSAGECREEMRRVPVLPQSVLEQAGEMDEEELADFLNAFELSCMDLVSNPGSSLAGPPTDSRSSTSDGSEDSALYQLPEEGVEDDPSPHSLLLSTANTSLSFPRSYS